MDVSRDAVMDKPGSGVIIEPASWRDLNAVRHLEQVCFPQDVWPLWDLIGVLSFPNVVRLKAVSGGRLVGFIGVDIRERENMAWIATIGVLPEFRGQGIGRSLLDASEARLRGGRALLEASEARLRGVGRSLLEASEARLGGVGRIRLSVRVSNESAIRLYERAGYTRAGIWGKYYTDGEDALVMEKILG